METENTQEQNRMSEIDQIKGWNWGAFVFGWIWAIANQAWLGLLTLIPFVNIVMIFVLGAKGNEWSWKNKNWESVESFKKAQRIWNIVGLVVFILSIVGAIVGILITFLVLPNVISSPDSIVGSTLQIISEDSNVTDELGEPIERVGFPSTSVSIINNTKDTKASFKIAGPLGEGGVTVIKKEQFGQLVEQEIKVFLPSGEQLVLTPLEDEDLEKLPE